MQIPSVRTSLLSLSIALSLSACGGGGGGGSSAVNNNPAPATINGAISAPGGTVAWQARKAYRNGSWIGPCLPRMPISAA